MRGSTLYRICCYLTVPFVTIMYRVKIKGRENIPPGGAVLCGNHSSNFDPIFMAYAFKSTTQIHYMAKAELFKVPILGRILRAIGIFPVERGKQDVSAIKTAMKHLKNGEKLGIFPEGHRIKDENNTDAKTGAVLLATRTSMPIVPVYIAREKKWYRRVPVIIGEPYYVPLDKKTAKHEDYMIETVKLMETINGLGAVSR